MLQSKPLLNKVTCAYPKISSFLVSSPLLSSLFSSQRGLWVSVSNFFYVPTLHCLLVFLVFSCSGCMLFSLGNCIVWLLWVSFLVFSMVCSICLHFSKCICLASLGLLVNLRMSEWITRVIISEKSTRYLKKKRSCIWYFPYSLYSYPNPEPSVLGLGSGNVLMRALTQLQIQERRNNFCICIAIGAWRFKGVCLLHVLDSG